MPGPLQALSPRSTGHNPQRILADKIYRNRANISYYKAHGIRILGPSLGRKPKRVKPEEKRSEYQDNVDRIEVERGFSLAKRCYGLGRIWTKREDTSFSSIMLSIIAMNVDKQAAFLRRILMIIFSRYTQHHSAACFIQNGLCVRC
ncbi:MAG: transposase [Firmicutes bacterium]|nr:transposase [Bacillota bacterium]MBQ1887304.1 transposase [Bacillota bacterium]MBQ2456142.1 transposase [Bacillota bacterium]MBQ4235080.1 transposase [Bacillota bacterium]MBQ5436069.1 transposase [Bacillota bacterium]